MNRQDWPVSMHCKNIGCEFAETGLVEASNSWECSIRGPASPMTRQGRLLSCKSGFR
jgi:hypothetical protein